MLRRSLLLFAAVALFPACNSQEVKVGKKGEASSANLPANIRHLNVNAATLNDAPKTVFFEQVRVLPKRASGARDNSKEELLSVIGVGFLPSIASTTKAYGFGFHGAMITTGPGMAYVNLDGSVVVVDTSRMETSTIARIDSGTVDAPTSFSVSQDNKLIAWTRVDGQAFVYSVTDRQKSAVDLRGARAAALRFEQSNNLTVQAFGECQIFSADDLKNPKLRFVGSDCAMNPSGTKVAFVNKNGLAVYDRITDATQESLGVAFDPRELSWKNDHEISYWTMSTGSKEIQVLDVDTGTEYTVASLQLVTDAGIVCPAWLGESVYFTDYTDGAYVIARASFDGSNWRPSTFAKSRRENVGYVCPRIATKEAP